MKKVVDISSRRLFGQFYPPAPTAVPEGFRFAVTTAFAFIAPTLAYCYVTNQIQPLYVISVLLGLGALVGALLNWKRSRRLGGKPIEPATRSSQTANGKRNRDAA